MAAAALPPKRIFLIGLCSFGRLPDPQSFVYVPKAREFTPRARQHVQLLEQQLACEPRNGWPKCRPSAIRCSACMHQLADELMANPLGRKLGSELEALGEVLTNERKDADALTQAYDAKVAHLEGENVAKTEWARPPRRASKKRRVNWRSACACSSRGGHRESGRCGPKYRKLRADLTAQMDLIRKSRWVRLGRKFRLGPNL